MQIWSVIKIIIRWSSRYFTLSSLQCTGIVCFYQQNCRIQQFIFIFVLTTLQGFQGTLEITGTQDLLKEEKCFRLSVEPILRKLWWEMCCITMATGRVDAETPLAARLQLSLSVACTKGGPSPKRSLSLKGNKRRWEDSFLSDLDSVQPPSKCLQRPTDWKELLTGHFRERSCVQKKSGVGDVLNVAFCRSVLQYWIVSVFWTKKY